VARNQGSGGTSTSSSNSSSGNGSGSDNGNSGAKQGKERDRRAESNDDGPTIPQLMSVKAAPMQHTVPCVGYVIKESERPGRLRFDNVRELVEAHKDELKEQLGLRDANKVYAVLKNMKPDQVRTLTVVAIVAITIIAIYQELSQLSQLSYRL